VSKSAAGVHLKASTLRHCGDDYHVFNHAGLHRQAHILRISALGLLFRIQFKTNVPLETKMRPISLDAQIFDVFQMKDPLIVPVIVTHQQNVVTSRRQAVRQRADDRGDACVPAVSCDLTDYKDAKRFVAGNPEDLVTHKTSLI
jgi:hypothetical protein